MKFTKRISQFLLVFSLVGFAGNYGFSVGAPKGPSKNSKRFVVQTQVRNPLKLRQLSAWLEANNYDVAGMNWRRGQIEVIADDQSINFLKTKGLKGIDIIQRPAAPFDPRYLNPDKVTKKLQAIAQAFPNLTRLEQIGRSIQGRPIWALLISDTPKAGDPQGLQKPSILFDGLHHAREIMTPEIVFDVAETVLKGVAVSQQARDLVHRWQIWLVPMLNVDGSNIVWTDDNMWRKNAHASLDSLFGVDLNRNYAFNWNRCSGSSGSPSSPIYRGSAKASEPESLALMNLAEAIRPTASLSYHSFSEFVLYPYGCDGEFTPEKQLVEKIAGELASRLPADDQSGNYTPGTPWQLLYNVDGDSMSFMYGTYGTLSYTFEINQDFQPSYDLRDATVAKHRVAWKYFLNRIDQNLLSVSIMDGKANKPAVALISVDTISPSKGELPYKTNAAGRYFKVLDPGSYAITAKLPDGRTGHAKVQMAGKPQDLNLVIQ